MAVDRKIRIIEDNAGQIHVQITEGQLYWQADTPDAAVAAQWLTDATPLSDWEGSTEEEDGILDLDGTDTNYTAWDSGAEFLISNRGGTTAQALRSLLRAQIGHPYFYRLDDHGHAVILDAGDGSAITHIDDAEIVYPIGASTSVRHEHPEGIVLSVADAELLGIRHEDA